MPGVVHGCFLLELLHDGGFDFLDVGGRGGAGTGTEEGHFLFFLFLANANMVVKVV